MKVLPAVEKAIKRFKTEAEKKAFIQGIEIAIGVTQGTLYRLAGLEPENKISEG